MYNTMPENDEKSKAKFMLSKIAEIIGCPVKYFSNTGEGQPNEISRLLTIWLAIKDPQDRRKALAWLQSMAAQVEPTGETKALAGNEPLALPHTLHEPE